MPNTATNGLGYIEDQAQFIYDRWVASGASGTDGIPDDADAFQETFVDALESAAAGPPPDIFPTLDEETMTLIYNLIAARIYQLMMNPTITNDED